MKSSIFVVLVLLYIPFTSAAPLLPCKQSSFAKYEKLAQKISVIGSDSRLTFDEYAAQKSTTTSRINAKFAATGMIVCDGKAATAQLSGFNNVISTARHVFYSSKTCSNNAFEKCDFRITRGRNQWDEVYPIKLKSLRMGPCSKNIADDWAVLELEKPVKNIKPYALPKEDNRPRTGDPLIQVSAASANFVRNGNRPRYITECSVRNTGRFNNHPVQTDCDSGIGASGSALLIEKNNELVIQSVLSGSIDARDGLPYDPDRQFTTAAPLTGPFLEAIHALGGAQMTSTPEKKPPVKKSSTEDIEI